jgi:hypothetical protein
MPLWVCLAQRKGRKGVSNMQKTREETQITTTGVLVPTDWDSEGSISAIAISTPREEEYFINNDEIGEELLDLYGAEVLVTGIVTEDSEGNKTLTVKKYELLGEDDEDEEEYTEDDDYEELDEYEDDEEEWDE